MNTKKILFPILFICGQNLYALTYQELQQQASQTQQKINEIRDMLITTSDPYVKTYDSYNKELTSRLSNLQAIVNDIQTTKMKVDNAWKKLDELNEKQKTLPYGKEFNEITKQKVQIGRELVPNAHRLEDLVNKQFPAARKAAQEALNKFNDLKNTFEGTNGKITKLQQAFKEQKDKLQAIKDQISASMPSMPIMPPDNPPAPNFDADTTTLNTPYGMQLANLNSLNKRMGELRENANANGVWARVFSGLQTTKFGTRNDTFYTTIQGGYDHAFGFNGANNYLGFAISYMNSVVNKDHSLDTLNSNGVEFAIYNAYVQDGASKANSFKNGFYNDSVIKLGYIHTQAGMNNNNSATDSFSFILSNELGYRFLLGETGDFFIDPQLELALAYLDQSVLKQILAGNPLTGNQDAIITLRGRVGSNFGYRFDEYTQDKNFRSEIYLGTYFVGDYITGGKINFTHPYKSLSISPLESTARWTLNLGTNFTIKDNHRIYFDFERSFFGSIITQYQVSLGYRYSFGTSKYTSLENTVKASNEAKVQEVAPTKGYYIKLLDTANPSKKQNRILSKIEDLKTQNNGNTKAYLVGPFTSFKQAKTSMDAYKGMAKELNSQAEIIEVE